MIFDRKKVGAAAKEIADHLQLVDNVRALQTAQKELADALVALGDRLRAVESDMRVLKAEVKFEALKETQAAVNAVQGHLNQRIETIAVRLGIMTHESRGGAIAARPAPTLPGAADTNEEV